MNYIQEIENVTSTYEQTQTEREEATKKLQKLEVAYRKMEKEKNELIQVTPCPRTHTDSSLLKVTQG